MHEKTIGFLMRLVEMGKGASGKWKYGKETQLSIEFII